MSLILEGKERGGDKCRGSSQRGKEGDSGTSSACFLSWGSTLFSESLRQQASCLNGSSCGCQSMLERCKVDWSQRL
jgi:hypothetical protein